MDVFAFRELINNMLSFAEGRKALKKIYHYCFSEIKNPEYYEGGGRYSLWHYIYEDEHNMSDDVLRIEELQELILTHASNKLRDFRNVLLEKKEEKRCLWQQ
jgi:hypothetical protein